MKWIKSYKLYESIDSNEMYKADQRLFDIVNDSLTELLDNGFNIRATYNYKNSCLDRIFLTKCTKESMPGIWTEYDYNCDEDLDVTFNLEDVIEHIESLNSRIYNTYKLKPSYMFLTHDYYEEVEGNVLPNNEGEYVYIEIRYK